MDLLGRDTVVVRQKAKFIEVTNEYFLYDADGNEIGWVVEEGQTSGHKWLRRLTKVGAMLAHQLAVADEGGRRVLTLRKPPSWIKARVEVRDADGAHVGTIRQLNWMFKVRFVLEDPHGFPLGELLADNWRNWDFRVVDGHGTELARVTKKWAGLAKEFFTTADNYVFTISPLSEGPMRMLCFAAALAIDTSLKQNSR